MTDQDKANNSYCYFLLKIKHNSNLIQEMLHSYLILTHINSS